jgi:hypothetical protein
LKAIKLLGKRCHSCTLPTNILGARGFSRAHHSKRHKEREDHCGGFAGSERQRIGEKGTAHDFDSQSDATQHYKHVAICLWRLS